jgi:hypothetical protein
MLVYLDDTDIGLLTNTKYTLLLEILPVKQITSAYFELITVVLKT